MKGSALKHRRKRFSTVPLYQTCQGYATAAKANKSGRGAGNNELGLYPRNHTNVISKLAQCPSRIARLHAQAKSYPQGCVE